jgi:hypothetical protein
MRVHSVQIVFKSIESKDLIFSWYNQMYIKSKLGPRLYNNLRDKIPVCFPIKAQKFVMGL